MFSCKSYLISFSLNFSIRNFNVMKRAELYRRCYEVLGVPENSDQSTVRRAYIEIVKKVHPDSGFSEASAEKFQEVDESFKFLMEKHAKARRNIEMDLEDEVKVFDIKHTAPQHRQFLTHGGFGMGTPFQREKQHQQRRAMKAQENVLEHRMQKAAATDNALIKKGGDHFKNHAIKTKYGFDRVVEDLIQEAMSKGDFNNLSGAGKPLTNLQSQNPYTDFTREKLNKILVENGFVPEWITLQKEIRDEIESLKVKLREERSKLHSRLDSSEDFRWSEKCEEFTQKINKKIDKFNLIVPMMSKQMVHVEVSRIAERILKEEISKIETKQPIPERNAPSNYKPNLFSFIDSIIK